MKRVRRSCIAVGLVALLTVAAPTPAGAANAGGGSVVGAVVYTSAGGLPPVGAPCRATTFHLDNVASNAFVVNTVVVGYAGPVTVRGTGAAICENATLGSGSLTLTAEGHNPTTNSRISCGSLTGTFIRVLTEATALLAGSCTVNSFDTSKITFVAEVDLQPTNPGDGVVTPVFSAAFAGVFTVSP